MVRSSIGFFILFPVERSSDERRGDHPCRSIRPYSLSLLAAFTFTRRRSVRSIRGLDRPPPGEHCDADRHSQNPGYLRDQQGPEHEIGGAPQPRLVESEGNEVPSLEEVARYGCPNNTFVGGKENCYHEQDNARHIEEMRLLDHVQVVLPRYGSIAPNLSLPGLPRKSYADIPAFTHLKRDSRKSRPLQYVAY